MNGELQHMATLAAYGNAYLNNCQDFTVSEKDKYVLSVSFIRHEHNKIAAFWRKLLNQDIVAQSEEDWFKYLTAKGFKTLRLIINQKTDDINLVAFANGIGGWHIHAISDARSELWFREWHSTGNGWQVIYHGVVVEHYDEEDERISVSELSSKLAKILNEIGDFAVAIGCSEWKKWFDKGRAALESDADQATSILPKIYSPEARRLIAAAREAWVFGGMGWWNDSPPYMARDAGKEEEYDRLTAELYETIMKCTQASVNSITWR